MTSLNGADTSGWPRRGCGGASYRSGKSQEEIGQRRGEASYNQKGGPKYSPPREAFPLGCLHAATTPASKGLGAANLLIVA